MRTHWGSEVWDELRKGGVLSGAILLASVVIAYGALDSNTLIIMTSNIGAEYLVNQPEGEDTSAVREQVMAMVREHFRPEFLNRIDEIILFDRLQKSEMGRIVEIQFTRLQKLLDDRKITLSLDAKARKWLADKGWDPAYGARPLKRVIQRFVQDPLAEMMLAGDVRDNSTVKISTGKDGLTFNGKTVNTADEDVLEPI
jgi:ATP-dependent Clp protease ATP-binding subunit ClpB